MATPKAETNDTPSAETARNDELIEEKKAASHDERLGRFTPDGDVEEAREDVDQHPAMTWRRFMAIFSLGCLLAAAQIPLYLIGGSLCTRTPSGPS